MKLKILETAPNEGFRRHAFWLSGSGGPGAEPLPTSTIAGQAAYVPQRRKPQSAACIVSLLFAK